MDDLTMDAIKNLHGIIKLMRDQMELQNRRMDLIKEMVENQNKIIKSMSELLTVRGLA